MADINAVKVDSVIKVEKASISPTLKFGGDKEIFNVSGDLVVNQVYAGTVSPQNPDLLVQESQAILSETTSQNPIQNLELVLSPFFGIVKSPFLKGTRVQLEFTIINSNDIPKVIKGTYAEINGGTVNFKLFFSVNADGVRQPDLTVRYPIVVNAKGVARLSVEFENLEQQFIDKGVLNCELYVLIGDINVITKKFTLEVNDAMVNTLNAMNKAANENNAPILFDTRIKS